MPRKITIDPEFASDPEELSREQLIELALEAYLTASYRFNPAMVYLYVELQMTSELYLVYCSVSGVVGVILVGLLLSLGCCLSNPSRSL